MNNVEVLNYDALRLDMSNENSVVQHNRRLCIREPVERQGLMSLEELLCTLHINDVVTTWQFSHA